jgi:hypothetical protein
MPAPLEADGRQTDPLGLLIDLCEQDPPTIEGATLVSCFADAGRPLFDLGALRPVSSTSVVVCRACHEQHPAEPEFDPKTGNYAHFCPHAGWVSMPETDLVHYEVDIAWMVASLGQAIGVPGGSRCLVERTLWDLGEARAGDQPWTALFGRRLWPAQQLDRVFDALARRAGKAPGLLLTTTADLPSRIDWPGGHVPVALADCAAIDAAGLVIDHRVIVGALRSGAGGKRSSGTPGRPTSKDLYIAEHRRRIASGEAHRSIREEARHLDRWFRDAYPREITVAPKSIENIIRSAHNAWKDS